MGYRGKLGERQRARELRAQGWTLQEIADELGVSKSSVSLWVRDVEFEPKPRRRTARSSNGPNQLRARKEAEIRHMLDEGRRRVRSMTEREFLVAGVALYAGEGSKTDGAVKFANTNPAMVAFFCAWLRHFFAIDETRVRCRLYLHQGLDLEAATAFWSELTMIPLTRFGTPYRAVPDAGIRNSKHRYGCATVSYSCSRTHRAVMGLVHAVLAPSALPGKIEVPPPVHCG